MASETQKFEVWVCPKHGIVDENDLIDFMDSPSTAFDPDGYSDRYYCNQCNTELGIPPETTLVEVVPRSELDDLPRELGLIASLSAEVERLRAALQDALTGIEVAANMTCTCDGYYKCNGCPYEIAEQAQLTADVLRAALVGRATEVPDAE